MGKLSVFNFVTLNGYFKGPNGDISWHKPGPEENEYSIESLKAGNTLLLEHVTYEMMASYWPSEKGLEAIARKAQELGLSRLITSSYLTITNLTADLRLK